MNKLIIPEDLQGKKLSEFLFANKRLLIAQKKYELKRGDAFSFVTAVVEGEVADEVQKAAGSTGTEEAPDFLEITSVINTTNWLDSHKDLHLPGLWKKSLKENKDLYLLEEHNMSFKGIIADGDDLEAYTKTMLWKEFGLKIPGETEALIFKSIVKKGRNPYMFKQYKEKRVKNHSVGMRYVNIEMAINDEEYKEEFALWNKYIGQIANPEAAEDSGYFFPVKEAKVIEGSAVVIGSNRMTPTINENKKNIGSTEEAEPLESTSITQPQKADVDLWIKTVKFFN